MLRSILVVLDTSPDGSAAVELSMQWGQHYRASLVGLAVVDEPAICRPEPLPIGGSYFKAHRNAVLLDDARDTVRQLLDEFARRCAAAAVPCTVFERIGSPPEQIALEGQRCDLVLIGRQTRFHFGARPASEGTPLRVLQHSARPVVVVPPHRVGAGPVIIVFDGGTASARALYAFQAAGLGSDGEVCLVSLESDGRASAGADRAVEFLRSHGINVRRETVPTAAPQATAEAILPMARRLDARLLVMGGQRQSTMRGFLRGSLMDAVLEHCDTPLFLWQ